MSVLFLQCFRVKFSRYAKQPLQSRADRNTQPTANAKAYTERLPRGDMH